MIDTLEKLVERTLLASRWLLTVFYLVLAASLAVYAVYFVVRFVKTALGVFQMGEDEIVLAMLGLIDASLVAGLILMVMISSYENFVSRFDDTNSELSWLGKIDSGSLKIKLASAIVAISSIHLLQLFLNLHEEHDEKVPLLAIALHFTFLFSALILAYVDKLMAHPPHGPAHAPATPAPPPHQIVPPPHRELPKEGPFEENEVS